MLLDLGVRPEDRVLLALSDGKEFVASWWAALKVGAVVAEAYTFLQVKDYAYYAEYTRAQVIVVDETTRAKVEKAVGGMLSRGFWVRNGGQPPKWQEHVLKKAFKAGTNSSLHVC